MGFWTCSVDFLSANLVDSTKWTEPTCWTGPKAALYQSFDGSDGLVLMERLQEVSNIPLVTGKVNNLRKLCWFNIQHPMGTSKVS